MAKRTTKKELTGEDLAIEVAKVFFATKLNKNSVEVFVMGKATFATPNRAFNAQQYAGNPRPDVYKVVKEGKGFKAIKVK